MIKDYMIVAAMMIANFLSASEDGALLKMIRLS